METVSFFSEETIIKRASDDTKYYKTPFLYLVFAYLRNQAMAWADEKYSYVKKKKTGAWMIYKFVREK